MAKNEDNTGKGTRLTRIQKVDGAPAAAEGPPWVTVVRILNPVGAAAEAFAKALSHRVEMKRLEVEAERIAREAGIIEKAVDATYKLKMEELSHRKIAIERAFDTIQQELSQLHLQRMEVLKMAQDATRAALSDDLTLEERSLAKDLAQELTSTLPKFGTEANKNLETLVQALPTVELSRHLLPPSSE